jgi:hypothetical protein
LDKNYDRNLIQKGARGIYLVVVYRRDREELLLSYVRKYLVSEKK